MRAASETAVAPHKDDRRLLIAAAALTVAMLALQFTTPDVFLAVAAANLAVALYLRKLLPATATAAAER
jgi:hypothetical protein